MPTRVAVAEDHPQLRERLLHQLSYFEDIEVLFASESGDAFLADLAVRARGRSPMPEVVLMDIEMPGTDGIATTARLKALHPEIEVLILTVFEDADKIFAAVQAGASGYLLKDAGAAAIVGAVEEIAAGGAPTSPLVARKLLGYVRDHGPASAGASGGDAIHLTPREQDVLARLVEAQTEAGIAESLGVSAHTVRSHVKNLYAKLQVHSRAQVVRVAYERGLV